MQCSNYGRGCRGFPRHWSLLSPALLEPKPSQPGILFIPGSARLCLTTMAKATEYVPSTLAPLPLTAISARSDPLFPFPSHVLNKCHVIIYSMGKYMVWRHTSCRRKTVKNSFLIIILSVNANLKLVCDYCIVCVLPFLFLSQSLYRLHVAACIVSFYLFSWCLPWPLLLVLSRLLVRPHDITTDWIGYG